ncbi:MAG: Hpt domain-containing protein [Thermodesulfobacteriota bacterium]|nr:Hpt domain-containing protein [Thermodesulfobacteriota bacterium]
MTATDPINIDEALEVMDGDSELLLECFDDFVEDMPGMLARIRNALDQEDKAELKIACHKLKGSLRYLAAARAADLAYKLEVTDDTGDLTNADDLFVTLQGECEKIQAFVQNYKQKYA